MFSLQFRLLEFWSGFWVFVCLFFICSGGCFIFKLEARLIQKAWVRCVVGQEPGVSGVDGCRKRVKEGTLERRGGEGGRAHQKAECWCCPGGASVGSTFDRKAKPPTSSSPAIHKSWVLSACSAHTGALLFTPQNPAKWGSGQDRLQKVVVSEVVPIKL